MVLDCHFYQAFYPWDTRRTYAQHLAKARRRARLVAWLQRQQPVLVGEWSAALDPAPWWVVPSRPPSGRRLRRRPARGLRNALGWCYWSYKTNTRDDWNFRHQVESGVIRL